VLRFNAAAPTVIAEQKLARLRQAMALSGSADVADAIAQMNSRLGLPVGLGAMGVAESMFDHVVYGALRDHCHKTNPREASAEDYRRLLGESL
jgi:alcohol dehydrogenase class IV